jgi:hypothetical protein
MPSVPGTRRALSERSASRLESGTLGVATPGRRRPVGKAFSARVSASRRQTGQANHENQPQAGETPGLTFS